MAPAPDGVTRAGEKAWTVDVNADLDKRARDRILLFAGGYAETLEQCVTFLEHGIPLASWFFLLRGAGDPMKTAGKSGSYGGFAEPFQPTNTG